MEGLVDKRPFTTGFITHPKIHDSINPFFNFRGEPEEVFPLCKAGIRPVPR
jgi:hypothetical protein